MLGRPKGFVPGSGLAKGFVTVPGPFSALVKSTLASSVAHRK